MSVSVIRPLPEDLINQIAAGEVVERPASVLKELLENSLDSGATDIEIHLISGGLEEIKVFDNGSGISQTDLPLAVQRHATSKIKTAQDLEAIGTFGFRGEALSSICSVSELTLKSRTALDSSGYQLTLSEGVPTGPVQTISVPQGTQITVSHLFRNMPGRRKFLRSSHTELTHCQRIVKEIALAHPGVRFTLRNENRALGTWLTSTRHERFQECLKLSFEPLAIRETREEMTLEAYLSPPEYAVARSELYFYINGRPVRHRPFLSAIRTAFLECFGAGREPIGACYLDIRKDWVDVNVHPQKWEVRCLNQESIYYWLLSTFRKQLIPSRSLPSASKPIGLSSFVAPTQAPAPTFSSPKPSYPFTFLAKTDSFLVCEFSEGILVAELESLAHSADLKRLTQMWNQKSWPIETLQIPKVVRLSGKLRLRAEQERFFLERWGFQTDSFGDGDFSIRTRPSLISESQIESVFLRFIEQMSLHISWIQEPSAQAKNIISWLMTNGSSGSSLPLSELLSELNRQLKLPDHQRLSSIHHIVQQRQHPSKEFT